MAFGHQRRGYQKNSEISFHHGVYIFFGRTFFYIQTTLLIVGASGDGEPDWDGTLHGLEA